MPLRTVRNCCALAALVLLCVPAGASAATKPIDIRVLTSAGKTLADFRQYTGSVDFDASHKAKCFGPDSPSSDNSYHVQGATLLGALVDAAQHRSSLRPLLITDAFVDDGFGVGVCGINEVVAPFDYPAPYWYSAVDGVASSTGPDLVPVKAGDDELWYFTTGEESGFPNQLVLKAPVQVAPETPFQVKVTRISAGDGSAAPAQGVAVTGALTSTDEHGKVIVPGAAAGTLHLHATGSGDDVRSAVSAVCVDADPANCPVARSLTIFGSTRPDQIHGGKGWDSIRAGAGDDSIDIGQGGHDKVACGPGHDQVTGAGSDDDVGASCEVTKS
jgi:hypothetical protein